MTFNLYKLPCLYPRTTFDQWFPNWLNVDWPLQENMWHPCPIVLIRLLLPGLLRWHFKVKASATLFKLFSSHHVSYYAHIQSSTMVSLWVVPWCAPWFLLSFLKFFAGLGLCCCLQAFTSCSEKGLLFVVVHRLLVAMTSLVVVDSL